MSIWKDQIIENIRKYLRRNLLNYNTGKSVVPMAIQSSIRYYTYLPRGLIIWVTMSPSLRLTEGMKLFESKAISEAETNTINTAIVQKFWIETTAIIREHFQNFAQCPLSTNAVRFYRNLLFTNNVEFFILKKIA